ncbi:MAG: hypothetical protein ACC683_11825, partial [Acidimicrobiia bacterium]
KHFARSSSSEAGSATGDEVEPHNFDRDPSSAVCCASRHTSSVATGCGGLREPAAHRRWESDPQHPLHDPGRVVTDLVVG